MIFDFTCYIYTERILFSILSLFIKLIKSRVFLYLYCTNRTIYKTNNLYTHTHTFCFFSQRVESNELIHPLSINSLFPFFYHGRDSSVQRRFPHSWIKPVTCFLRYYSTVKTRIPLCRGECVVIQKLYHRLFVLESNEMLVDFGWKKTIWVIESANDLSILVLDGFPHLCAFNW